MLDFAKPEDRDDLKVLWLTCFGGPQSYIDFYYDRRFVPEDTLVWRENGRPVSMMTLMRIRTNGEEGASVYERTWDDLFHIGPCGAGAFSYVREAGLPELLSHLDPGRGKTRIGKNIHRLQLSGVSGAASSFSLPDPRSCLASGKGASVGIRGADRLRRDGASVFGRRNGLLCGLYAGGKRLADPGNHRKRSDPDRTEPARALSNAAGTDPVFQIPSRFSESALWYGTPAGWKSGNRRLYGFDAGLTTVMSKYFTSKNAIKTNK